MKLRPGLVFLLLIGLIVALFLVWELSFGGEGEIPEPETEESTPVGTAEMEEGAEPSASGSQTVDERVSIASKPGAAASDQTAAAAAIRIRIVDEDGSALAEASAFLSELGRIDWIEAGVGADAEGWIELSREYVDAGAPCILVAPGYAMRLIRLPDDSKTYALEEDDTLELEVLWAADRKPVSGAQLSWEFAEPFPSHRMRWVYWPWIHFAHRRIYEGQIATDAQGRARLGGARAGNWFTTLKCEYDGVPLRILDLGREAEWDLTIERFRATVVLVEPAAAFQARLEDGRGQALSGVDVELRRERSRLFKAKSDRFGVVAFEAAGLATGDALGLVAQLERVDHAGLVPTEQAEALTRESGWPRTWLADRPTRWEGRTAVYVVRHQGIDVKLVHPEPQRFEVASAHARQSPRLSQSFPDYFQVRPPQPMWIPLGNDGSQVLMAGWQGDPTCVLLRERHSGLILARQKVEPGVPVRFELPAACRLKILAEGQVPVADWRLEVRHLGTPGPRGTQYASGSLEDQGVLLRDLPVEWALPFGRYQFDLVKGLDRSRYAEVELLQPVDELRIRMEGIRKIRGTVRSSIGGLVANAGIAIHGLDGTRIARAKADYAGQFQMELFQAGELEIEAKWPEIQGQWWLDDWGATRRRLAAEPEIELELVLEECRLRVSKDPTDALLKECSVYLRRWDAGQGSFDGQRLVEALEVADHAELIVSPGEYAFSFGTHSQDSTERIRVAAGEVHEVELSLREMGRLDFVVIGPEEAYARLKLELMTASSQPAFESEFIVDEIGKPGGYGFRSAYVAPPGDFRLAVETTLHLADGRSFAAQETVSCSLQAGKATQIELRYDEAGRLTVTASR